MLCILYCVAQFKSGGLAPGLDNHSCKANISRCTFTPKVPSSNKPNNYFPKTVMYNMIYNMSTILIDMMYNIKVTEDSHWETSFQISIQIIIWPTIFFYKYFTSNLGSIFSFKCFFKNLWSKSGLKHLLQICNESAYPSLISTGKKNDQLHTMITSPA